MNKINANYEKGIANVEIYVLFAGISVAATVQLQ